MSSVRDNHGKMAAFSFEASPRETGAGRDRLFGQGGEFGGPGVLDPDNRARQGGIDLYARGAAGLI